MMNAFKEEKYRCHKHQFKSISTDGYPAKTYVRIFRSQIDIIRYSLIDDKKKKQYNDFVVLKKYKDRYLVAEYFAFKHESFLEIVEFYQHIGKFYIKKNI